MLDYIIGRNLFKDVQVYFYFSLFIKAGTMVNHVFFIFYNSLVNHVIFISCACIWLLTILVVRSTIHSLANEISVLTLEKMDS